MWPFPLYVFPLSVCPQLTISQGFFAHTRNPNYLGEVLIYSAYAVLAQHWIPWALCGAVWLQLFVPNMLQKDRRMSRHPGWDEYVSTTGLILPSLRLVPAFLCWVLADTREQGRPPVGGTASPEKLCQAGTETDAATATDARIKVADSDEPYQLASQQGKTR